MPVYRLIVLRPVRPAAPFLLLDPDLVIRLDSDVRRRALVCRFKEVRLIALREVLDVIEGLVFDFGGNDQRSGFKESAILRVSASPVPSQERIPFQKRRSARNPCRLTLTMAPIARLTVFHSTRSSKIDSLMSVLCVQAFF